jgi:radical SAM/Cys-rich protein
MTAEGLHSIPVRAAAPGPSKYDFDAQLRANGIDPAPLSIDTLQVNITKLCNQACRHCHVDASPARREMMTPEGIARCVSILAAEPRIRKLDITGGAPELHPQFEALVTQAAALGRHVMVRHNLTVQIDPHPQTGRRLDHLPDFFARHRVEVISSLPYYQTFFTDAQRGAGTFEKSIAALRRLNEAGYGAPGNGRVLNLVVNPVGQYLPAAQSALEADFRRELAAGFGIAFNALYTITNMPIHRFRQHLEKSGQYEAYMDKLLAAFNPDAAAGVMCRTLLSVDHEGRLYDCDFNQQLGLGVAGGDGPAGGQGAAASIFDFDFDRLLARRIRFADHCLGCTAGAGSSCGGATA